VGRKHRRKYDHKKPPEDKPATVVGVPPENPNAHHCEAVQQECSKKEEPTEWWRNPEWGKVIAESAIAFFTLASFIALWIQLKDARESFIKQQRPYIWVFRSEKPEMKLGEKAAWTFYFINYGKAPAKGLKFRTKLMIGGYYPAKQPKEITELFGRIHPPGTEDVGTIVSPGDATNFGTAFSDAPVRQQDIKYAEDYDAGMLMFIYFEYFDLDGNMYSSEVCRMTRRGYPPGTIYTDCDVHSKVK